MKRFRSAVAQLIVIFFNQATGSLGFPSPRALQSFTNKTCFSARVVMSCYEPPCYKRIGSCFKLCVYRVMDVLGAGSLESTQEARVALRCASSNSLRFSRALQTSRVHPFKTRYTHTKHEPILYCTWEVFLTGDILCLQASIWRQNWVARVQELTRSSSSVSKS